MLKQYIFGVFRKDVFTRIKRKFTKFTDCRVRERVDGPWDEYNNTVYEEDEIEDEEAKKIKENSIGKVMVVPRFEIGHDYYEYYIKCLKETLFDVRCCTPCPKEDKSA